MAIFHRLNMIKCGIFTRPVNVNNFLSVYNPLHLQRPVQRSFLALNEVFKLFSLYAEVYPQKQKWEHQMSSDETKNSIPVVNVAQF